MARTTTDLGTWTARLTGADADTDMQTWLITFPAGVETRDGYTTAGIFAKDERDANAKLRSFAW